MRGAETIKKMLWNVTAVMTWVRDQSKCSRRGWTKRGNPIIPALLPMNSPRKTTPTMTQP